MNDLFKFAESDEEHWISVSDLMAVLMMVFLLIVIVLQDLAKDDDKQKIINEFKEVNYLLLSFDEIEDKLRERLEEEFDYLFEDGTAELDADELIIRFNDPRVLFESGEATLKENFENILKKFFPKYLNILNEEQFRNYISEIRIEGHASSNYGDLPKDEAYFENMELSQDRTRAVLEYGISETDINKDKKLKEWSKSLLTANGLSSSQIILDEFSNEDKEASRRVEFEIRTNFKEEILKSLKRLQ